MRSIRRNVFETNSSSTHSLCIFNDSKPNYELYKHKELVVRTGKYGWSVEIYNDLSDKLSYLFTHLMAKYEENTCFEEILKNNKYMQIIKNLLEKHNIKIEWKKSGSKYFNYSYIDHNYEWDNQLKNLIENTKLLEKFLFNDENFITTGNDNNIYNYPITKEEYDKLEDEYKEDYFIVDKPFLLLEKGN